ncbi:MAG: hypothetical protein FRX48_04164 [Lasallia pustulata]|uniref:Uncharacterized protein n=1 Tax=Lasallia pustulata TaxID=136370 RepID=A0A5M8PTS9_9LECA|nr:MAG: hypothetical protein FRX48_04164 [Lasallia pustulata]
MLHLAAQRGNVPVVEYLVYAAKDFNINHRDSRGRTVLHYGVENKRARDTITALKSHGADIWARDCQERSALHHAAKLGNLPAVKALLALGMADELRAVDCFGMTPLKIAAYHKAHGVLTFLAGIESRWELGEQLRGPGSVGCRDLSAAETDTLLRTTLSTPARTRYDALPPRPRQINYWIDGGWRSQPRTSQCHQRRLSNLKAYCNVVTCLAVVVTRWTLVVFFFHD